MLTPLVTPTAEKNDDKGPCPNRDAYRPAPRCGRWSCLPCDNAEHPGSAKQMASELSTPECCRPDSLIGEFCDSEKVRTGISKRDRNSFKSGRQILLIYIIKRCSMNEMKRLGQYCFLKLTSWDIAKYLPSIVLMTLETQRLKSVSVMIN